MAHRLPTKPPFAIHATLIHSPSSYTGSTTTPNDLDFLPNTLFTVDHDGTISHLLPNILPIDVTSTLSKLDLPVDHPLTILHYPRHFLIPGLIDTHVHAPQHSMRGLGSAQGMHILNWLDEITFPHEARFADPEHARKVYSSCVQASLKQGITTACYYGSLHLEATKILADTCLEQGQRAFVGKTCMDNSTTNPGYYQETTTEALEGTASLIHHIQTIDPEGSLIRPIITPRFAISCTPKCLAGLGKILSLHDNDYGGFGVLMQTHFCEAEQEVSATLAQYPQFSSEVDLYQHYGLLNDKSVLAHCTTVTEGESKRVKDLDVGIAHCPIANCTVGGGFMAAPIRRYLDQVTNVGLGTDSGGGYSSSILDAMRQAIIVSNAREVMTGGKEKRLGLREVFWMGTLGGARVLGLEHIGLFEVGNWFDAVVVDTAPGADGGDEGVMTVVEEGEEWERVLEKFVMTGDDSNMVGVYVSGVRRK